MEYEYFGAAIDCCGGVMRVDKIKEFIDVLAKAGYNLLEIGTNTTYKIEGEEYFGYLNGGYTVDDFKQLDEYAKSKGIELVPSIQTLAHLSGITKLPHYANIVDVNDILLIDEPKTYELIDKMFATLRKGYSTKMINLGFDEAHMAGLGKYLKLHGYTDRFELLLRHLNKVAKIAKKYDFVPHMWSDMFFRLANGGDYYGSNIKIPQRVIDSVPPSVELAYWDYYADSEEHYNDMLTSHDAFGRKIWFAGGAWTWNGFAPLNGLSLKTMKPAMKQVIKHGVSKVLITLWSDGGSECSYFAVLPSLYAIRQYALGNFDEAKIKKGFKQAFGVEFDDLMILDIPNKSEKNPNCDKVSNACKSLLYNDCFLGWKDSALEQEAHIPYDEYAAALRAAQKRAGKYGIYHRVLASLCDALQYKAELGLKTRRAYVAGDKAALQALLSDYDSAIDAIRVFRDNFKELWFEEKRPYMWEVHEIRLGGLRARIADCKNRIEQFLNGEVEEIPELSEKLLPYADWGLQYNDYQRLVTLADL